MCHPLRGMRGVEVPLMIFKNENTVEMLLILSWVRAEAKAAYFLAARGAKVVSMKKALWLVAVVSVSLSAILPPLLRKALKFLKALVAAFAGLRAYSLVRVFLFGVRRS